MILLLALILGLGIPLGIIYLIETFNTKVRGKSDVKDVKMPFAGEIPSCGPVEKKKKKKNDEKATFDANAAVVVKAGNRNVVNEAFRVLRTNVEFMSQSTDSKVISFTSYNPGSGKSFNAINLSVALSLKQKRVLLIDCDLRHCSTSSIVGAPKKGLSSYLSGRVADIDSLLVPFKDNDCLDVLPVGIIPPNPSELIADKRFDDMIAYFRGKYDYIFLDCPPIDIVADAQIINRCVDRTLFVIRAGLFDRGSIPELDKLYEENKYKNIALILNGTEASGSGKYGYRYGYRYAYHYGHYGSSYYGSTEDEEESSKKS